MGKHGRVAGEGAQALAEHLSHLALPAGQVFLPVEDGEDDVAKAGEGDASTLLPGSLTTSKVDEVKPAPSSNHSTFPTLVHTVLVDVQGVQQVGASAGFILASLSKSSIEVSPNIN